MRNAMGDRSKADGVFMVYQNRCRPPESSNDVRLGADEKFAPRIDSCVQWFRVTGRAPSAGRAEPT